MGQLLHFGHFIHALGVFLLPKHRPILVEVGRPLAHPPPRKVLEAECAAAGADCQGEAHFDEYKESNGLQTIIAVPMRFLAPELQLDMATKMMPQTKTARSMTAATSSATSSIRSLYGTQMRR